MPMEHVDLSMTGLARKVGVKEVRIHFDPAHSVQGSLDVCYRETRSRAFKIRIIRESCFLQVPRRVKHETSIRLSPIPK